MAKNKPSQTVAGGTEAVMGSIIPCGPHEPEKSVTNGIAWPAWLYSTL